MFCFNRLPPGPSQEEKIKIHIIPSFSKPEPLVINNLTLRNKSFFLAHLTLHPNNTAWAFCLPGTCRWLFLWLSWGVTLPLIKIVFFTPYLRTSLECVRLFKTSRNLFCLSQPKPDKIFLKDLITIIRNLDKLES